uniref:NADP oxidoreductase coenzyme F420-dependent n=1 Tax=Pithovirus LCPAC201 TaxID=2506591 RepID=A0A481Z6R4_9VIRU|nr:MAG: NADP oxidoreductase coenzyme F420-dependent [Pithovirus LCPAC201]
MVRRFSFKTVHHWPPLKSYSFRWEFSKQNTHKIISRDDRIGIAGLGILGRRIARGLLNEINVSIESSPLVVRKHLLGLGASSMTMLNKHPSEINATSLENVSSLQETEGFMVYESNQKLIENCSTLFISVKPNQVESICHDIKDSVKNDDIIISVAAGVDLQRLNKWLPKCKKVRAMPNLPIEIGQGSVALYSDQTDPEFRQKIESYFNGSTCLWVEEEQKIDIITAVSGCAPAYISYYLKLMIQSGINLGLSEKEARTLLIPTFRGTSKLFDKFSPQEIIEMTACKGGATERAMKIFDQKDMEGIITSVQSSALERIKEISRNL